MSQSLKCLALDLSSGLELRVEFKPHFGPRATHGVYLKKQKFSLSKIENPEKFQGRYIEMIFLK